MVMVRTSWMVNFALFCCYRPVGLIYTRPECTQPTRQYSIQWVIEWILIVGRFSVGVAEMKLVRSWRRRATARRVILRTRAPVRHAEVEPLRNRTRRRSDTPVLSGVRRRRPIHRRP